MPQFHRVAAAALDALPVLAFAAVTPISDVRPFDQDGQVTIDNTKGAVVVRGGNPSEVRISGILGEGVERLAIDGDRNHLYIHVINPHSKGWFGNWGGAKSGETKLEITVPTHASIAVEGVSATTDVRGVGGRRLAITTVSGNVHVEASAVEAQIASVSGALHLRLDTSKIHVESVSGDLDLQGHINGEVRVGTVSGHIELSAETPSVVDVSAVSGDAELRTGLAPGGQLKAESTSGALKLALPAGSSLRLEASTSSGRIHSDSGSVQAGQHGAGSFLKTRIGRGDASVKLESFSGDLTVKSH